MVSKEPHRQSPGNPTWARPLTAGEDGSGGRGQGRGRAVGAAWHPDQPPRPSTFLTRPLTRLLLSLHIFKMGTRTAPAARTSMRGPRLTQPGARWFPPHLLHHPPLAAGSHPHLQEAAGARPYSHHAAPKYPSSPKLTRPSQTRGPLLHAQEPAGTASALRLFSLPASVGPDSPSQDLGSCILDAAESAVFDALSSRSGL